MSQLPGSPMDRNPWNPYGGGGGGADPYEAIRKEADRYRSASRARGLPMRRRYQPAEEFSLPPTPVGGPSYAPPIGSPMGGGGMGGSPMPSPMRGSGGGYGGSPMPPRPDSPLPQVGGLAPPNQLPPMRGSGGGYGGPPMPPRPVEDLRLPPSPVGGLTPPGPANPLPPMRGSGGGYGGPPTPVGTGDGGGGLSPVQPQPWAASGQMPGGVIPGSALRRKPEQVAGQRLPPPGDFGPFRY